MPPGKGESRMNPANEPLREANRAYQRRRRKRWRWQRLVLVGALLFVAGWLTGGLLTEILVGFVLEILVTGSSGL